MKSFLSAMQQYRLLALTAATLLGLTACGGSSSGSSASTSAKTTVLGVLVDPAIKNASIHLNNRAGDAITSIVRTDEQGQFTFSNINSRQLIDAQLLSHGGIDTVTGTDFTGVSFKAQYQTTATVLITPLTTLVVEEMANNSSYADAVATIAQRFNLTNEQVLGNPTLDAELQKISFQLSELASAVRTLGGFSYVNNLTKDFGTDWDAIASSVANNADALTSVKDRVQALTDELMAIDALASSTSPTQLLTNANRIRFKAGLLNFFKNSLNYTPSATALINIQSLADALLIANSNNGIPSDSSHFANLVRYVFLHYQLTTSDFEDSNWSLPAALSNDSNIANIAQSSSVIDHTIPLLAAEYLTTNEAKRDYFYASDLAPAYRALKLFENVYDNSQTDDVFASIAASYAAKNMLEKADVILKSQIFTPFYVADGYRRTGDALVNVGDINNAVRYWNESLRIAQIYMEDKGWNNLDGNDASLFQSLSGSLLKYGDPEIAVNVLTPVNEFITENSGVYTTAYARIVVAIGSQVGSAVDEAVAANLRSDLKATALEKVKFYGDILDGLGLQPSTTGSTAIACGTHYKLKANNLVGLANLYIELEEPTLVRESLQRFIDLRANHDCTRLESNVYVKNTMDAYAYLNDIDGYLSLIKNTMTGAKETDIATAQATAVQFVDAKSAKAGQVQQAIDNIIATDSNLNTQVQQLTNVGISESSVNARLASILFQDGFTNEGTEALNAAWAIVTSPAYKELNLDDGEQFSRYGCGKVARLTYQYLDNTTAANRLQACANLVDTFATEAAADAASAAYTYLAETALLQDHSAIAVDAFNNAVVTAKNLSGTNKINALADSVYYTITNGGLQNGININSMLAAMDELEALYTDAATNAVDQTQYKDAVNLSNSIVSRYGHLLTALRTHHLLQSPMPNLADITKTIQDRATNLALNAEIVVDKISNASTRTSYYGYLIGTSSSPSYLAMNNLFDMGPQLIGLMNTETAANINKYRVALAKDLLKYDAFPGSTIASIDIDQDGYADFYENGVSQTDIDAAGLQLDTDSDNDGTPDSMDSTPFYAQ